ncbi:MAG: phosphoenolpyruvate--protein phosphotransferase [Ktedonobacteraceae bacterium]
MPVGLVIVSHSAQLAAGVAELAGQMTQGKIPIATAGGAGNGILGTSVETILTAIQSVDGPDGVLVLLDLGSAILSTEMALEMLDDDQRNHVLLSSAPMVEGAIAAAVESSLGRTLAEVKLAAERTASVEQLRQLKPLAQNEETTETPVSPPTIAEQTPATNALEVQLTLTNPAGLHARPASLFVQTSGRFQSAIQVGLRGKQANALSIMAVLSLGVRQGDTITVRASGNDAQAALDALSELVHANFYETPPSHESSVGANVSRPPSFTDSLTDSSASARKDGGDISAPTTSDIPQGKDEPWRAIMTSRGVAVGPAFLYTSQRPALISVERRAISSEQVGAEQALLQKTLEQAAQELAAMTATVESNVGQAEAAIFTAQTLMLRDPELLAAMQNMIAEQHIDAASALAVTGEQQATTLEGLDDALLAARAADVRDAVSRAVQFLRGQGAEGVAPQDLSALRQPVILVARELTPSDTALLRPDVVLGICTTYGGPTAHAAILARSLGIPAIAGLNEAALSVIHTGDILGLDADRALLYHRPSQTAYTRLQQQASELQQRQSELKKAAQQAQIQGPLVVNGRTISLLANIASEAEAEAARQWGAEGVGLLRTEFLFATAQTLPGEDEQRNRYVRVFQAFKGDTTRRTGPIVVRTLDAGADKPMPALNAILGTATEANPALGLRGIRIHLAHPVLLEQQLRALLLAAADTGIELHIMFPMITTVEELVSARAIFERVYNELRDQHVALPAHVPVGIMVEVPSAAIMAPELAHIADFFSIGANDLLQYTLASDRTNTAVSHLYNPLQPAVLRLIHQIAEAGRNAGKPVAVCGEIAGDTRLAPILVALGIDELSMAPTALPAVRTTLSQLSATTLTAIAQQVLNASTVADVEQVSKS